MLTARDVETKAKEIKSRGTQQESVISPLLFNLLMIRVAHQRAEVENVEHTIYVDVSTLWVKRGSNAQEVMSCRKQ